MERWGYVFAEHLFPDVTAVCFQGDVDAVGTDRQKGRLFPASKLRAQALSLLCLGSRVVAHVAAASVMSLSQHRVAQAGVLLCKEHKFAISLVPLIYFFCNENKFHNESKLQEIF